jgi:predicted nucleic acid-binding protein
MSYVVDTNIFNDLLDGRILIKDLPNDGSYIATHVQIDEINNTKNGERRAQLFLMFAKLRPEIVPTESLVWDVSRWDEGKFSDGVLFEQLKQELDALNNSKPNNSKDVLIAEVAIVNGFTLLTADKDLANVMTNNRYKVTYFQKL